MNVYQNYQNCPICKHLIPRVYIQVHYKQCKDKYDEYLIREEIKKQNSTMYRYEILKKQIQEKEQFLKNLQSQSPPQQTPPTTTSNNHFGPYSQQKLNHKTYQNTISASSKENNQKIVDSIIYKPQSSPFYSNYSSKELPPTNEPSESESEIKKEEDNDNEKKAMTVHTYKAPQISIFHERVIVHFFKLYEKLFYDYVKDKAIALVGPAESILGTKKGHIIDNFDVVVRLNKSIPIPSELYPDVGTRTDILYNSLNTSDFPGENKLSPTLHKRCGVKFVCSSYPFNNSIFHNDILHYIQKYKFELPFKVMDDLRFQRFESYLGTRPYTGTCAIMDLLSFPIKYLYITGLDFYHSKYYQQYRQISKGQLKHTRNSNIHNAKPQLYYLQHMTLIDDRIILDSFLNKLLFEEYEKTYRNLKNIKLSHIYGFQTDSCKNYFESRDFVITYTREYRLDIDQEGKNMIVITSNRGFTPNDKQYQFLISQHFKELKELSKTNPNSHYLGNFYFTNQNLKEIPSFYLHNKYLIEIKNILMRVHIHNPSLQLLLLLSIIIFFPDQHIFTENDIKSISSTQEELKFINYLKRRKVLHIIKNN